MPFGALQCVSVRECERRSLNEVGEIAEFARKLESCVLDFESCAFNRTLPPLQRVFGCFQIGFANLGQFWANSGTVNASETGQTTSPINWQGIAVMTTRKRPTIVVRRIKVNRRSKITGYLSLRQALRHEYGHAFADLYRSLTRNKTFQSAFYGAYDNSRIPYVSRPCEIYADCFADFVRCRGIRSAVFSSPAERRQWRFVESLAKAVRRNP